MSKLVRGFVSGVAPQMIIGARLPTLSPQLISNLSTGAGTHILQH